MATECSDRWRTAQESWTLGDLGRAIPLLEQTLADRERVLGPDHPDTLTSRNNLAGAYESAGDLGRAIPLLEQTLADSERVLGPDHPVEQKQLRGLTQTPTGLEDVRASSMNALPDDSDRGVVGRDRRQVPELGGLEVHRIH